MVIFKNNKKYLALVFLFFTALVLIVFRDLFFSYFEADEWFHFTTYLPLTREPYGVLLSLLKAVTDVSPLSAGQHIDPIGEVVFFLNTKFFGMNFPLYAFFSLFFHAFNSFLVFLLIKELLRDHNTSQKGFVSSDMVPLLGGIFFAVSVVSTPAVTWAAFYGQNVISVTFFLLSILFFKWAFVTKQIFFLYLTVILFALALLTKETATSLFFIFPIMNIMEKRIFSLKYLAKVYIIILIAFISFRFGIPFASQKISHQVNLRNNTVAATVPAANLSIYKDIKRELLFRATTFPMKTISQLFFSTDTIHALIAFVAPIVYPSPPGISDINRSQNTQVMINGPGNDLMVYALSITILILMISAMREYYKNKQYTQLKAMGTGLAIIVFSVLPLIMIVFSFPLWGYDTYFDLRHYYLPSVGGAIILPLLFVCIANFISSVLRSIIHIRIPSIIIVILIFTLWLTNNLFFLNEKMKVNVTILGSVRRQIIEQMKQQLPSLPNNAVFFVQTDPLNLYGSQLPFDTSFPQILTVVYYDKSPFPNSFYATPVLDNQSEGYQYIDGRGLGYYTSKKALAEALVQHKFSLNNVSAFYFDSQKIKLTNTTSSIKKEMQGYLNRRKVYADWKVFQSSTSAETINFSYPPDTEVSESLIATNEAQLVKDIQINSPRFTASLKVMRVNPTFDIVETTNFVAKKNNSEIPVTKKFTFDAYQFNDMLVASTSAETEYFMKSDDVVVTATISNTQEATVLDKILGSIRVIKK